MENKPQLTPLDEFHLEEYRALRAEQRTRLDSANKIIHYYAILLAAVVVGTLSLYEEDNFEVIFPYILLLVPLISIPFAFAQQNEDLVVRNIGTYFEVLKKLISEDKINEFWLWEHHHIPNLLDQTTLVITTGFRASLIIVFSCLALGLFLLRYGCFLGFECKIDYTSWKAFILIVDYILIFAASFISAKMVLERFRQKKKIESDSTGNSEKMDENSESQ